MTKINIELDLDKLSLKEFDALKTLIVKNQLYDIAKIVRDKETEKIIEFYDKHGWVHLQNKIPGDIIDVIKEKGVKLRMWVQDKIGQPSPYGAPEYWEGIGCAGMYDDYLFDFYTSDKMYNLASELLKTKDVWIYNDQMVIKLPNDTLYFTKHTDNIFDHLNSVNLCVILDDFTEENGGTLDIYNTDDDKMITVYPKKGDIVAIHGNTWHKSNKNTSDEPRGLYACVYADEKIEFQNYYKRLLKW